MGFAGHVLRCLSPLRLQVSSAEHSSLLIGIAGITLNLKALLCPHFAIIPSEDKEDMGGRI